MSVLSESFYNMTVKSETFTKAEKVSDLTVMIYKIYLNYVFLVNCMGKVTYWTQSNKHTKVAGKQKLINFLLKRCLCQLVMFNVILFHSKLSDNNRERRKLRAMQTYSFCDKTQFALQKNLLSHPWLR